MEPAGPAVAGREPAGMDSADMDPVALGPGARMVVAADVGLVTGEGLDRLPRAMIVWVLVLGHRRHRSRDRRHYQTKCMAPFERLDRLRHYRSGSPK